MIVWIEGMFLMEYRQLLSISTGRAWWWGPDYEVNPEKVDARIPDEFLMKLLKMRLGKNDCLNRGYVLDGIPTTFKQAELLFKMIKLTDEGEEPDEENAEKIIDSERIPNSVILLEANDNYLYEKVKRLPEKVV